MGFSLLLWNGLGFLAAFPRQNIFFSFHIYETFKGYSPTKLILTFFFSFFENNIGYFTKEEPFGLTSS